MSRSPPLQAAPNIDVGKSVTRGDWKVTTHKRPILNSTEIEAMTTTLGIAPPEMIFGNNSVEVSNEKLNWSISFNALEALELVDKSGESMLKVAYSEAWQKMRERVHEDIKEVVKPYDWTYTTNYQGTVHNTNRPFQQTGSEIPFDKLKRPDPILLFDDVMLYEDELADNGISILSVKIRVMPERLLILQRFFMRLDGVLFRLRDTRLFIEFGTGEVIRQYQAREDTYANVRNGLCIHAPEQIPSLLRDDSFIAERLPVVELERERVLLG
ncbi:TIP41-domain-containing protein [Choiromyces venosus 120613-1]|uniref:TIP41-domain-containing protein n=1 Tax=Choiromyces venosus 120613-1 TaxID=1336337 RepID=A0A3N4JCN5_9PEZI|nr:TIP41-domain-containing protein [Choiromyces venosus 120613-1]